jgi:2-hydroxychromene-2-carboxylate isomerase
MNLPDHAHTPQNVVFFFDFGDPYAYLASRRIPRAAREAQAALTLEPVDARGLLEGRAAVGACPAEVSREAYWDGVRQAAAQFGIPVEPPKRFPFDSRLLLETCIFVKERSGQEAMMAVADALWRAVWQDGADPEQERTAIEAAHAVALPERALHESLGDPRLPEVLARLTRRAAMRGVRRVPTVQLEDRLFAGLEGVVAGERILRGDLPMPESGNDGPGEDGRDGPGPMPDWTFSG